MSSENLITDSPVQSDLTIGSVYPWGRSLTEYIGMFTLSDEDLGHRIIGCADGPASFNCEMMRRGAFVVSCDPLYQFSVEQIRGRIEKTADIHIDHVRKNPHKFIWDRIRSPEELRRLHLQAMEVFLADFPGGLLAGRYHNQSLPNLQFANASFDLALCSHFLFLYSDVFSCDFHLACILEMCRVAREVRIFPLLDMSARPSDHLKPVMRALNDRGCDAQVLNVPYEFQRGGNQMLRIRSDGERP
jgi:hypothetical protein